MTQLRITEADLYEALRQADPQAFNSGGLHRTKHWVLSNATLRAIAALNGGNPAEGYDFADAYVLGVPVRVDDAAEGLTFEDDPT
jgi:hypothetical protein